MSTTVGAEPTDQARDEILHALAERVLRGHLQNRRQLMDPPPVGLAGLDSPQREYLVRMMVAAAQAGGGRSPQKLARIERALVALGGGAQERGILASAWDNPVALETLLADVRDEQTASRAYAASMLATDRHARVDRAWLHYLACRLGLSPEVVAKLQRHFGHATTGGPG